MKTAELLVIGRKRRSRPSASAVCAAAVAPVATRRIRGPSVARVVVIDAPFDASGQAAQSPPSESVGSHRGYLGTSGLRSIFNAGRIVEVYQYSPSESLGLEVRILSIAREAFTRATDKSWATRPSCLLTAETGSRAARRGLHRRAAGAMKERWRRSGVLPLVEAGAFEAEGPGPHGPVPQGELSVARRVRNGPKGLAHATSASESGRERWRVDATPTDLRTRVKPE